MGRWDERLINQASDVPSICFFIIRALKDLYFYFCKFIKKNQKIIETIFAKNFARFYEKEIMLGTSDAWSMGHLSHCPSEPAYYIVDWRILSNKKLATAPCDQKRKSSLKHANKHS